MGEYKVWIDDNGIIRCVVGGSHRKQDAQKVIDDIKKHLKEKGKARILLDICNIEESTSDARRVYVNFIKKEPRILEKTALHGKKAMQRVMANFIIVASGCEKKVRYFRKEKEALRWLKK